MLDILEDYPNIDSVLNSLNELTPKLTSRIKYLVLNFLESYGKKKEKQKIINQEKELTKQEILARNSVDTYNNLVMEYMINNSMEEFLEAIKKRVEGEIVLALLRKYSPRSEDKLLVLINKLMEKNILNKNMINEKIELYQSNGELDDIAEECPIVIKFVEKLKTI